MREIKFRAWDKDKKQIVFPNRFVLVGGIIDSVYIDTYAGVNEEGILFKRMDRIKNFELMQFTGLKDKNGKDIYEGDVIATQQRDVLFEVIFGFNSDGNTYGWNYRSISKPKHIYSADNPKRLEIIGNIYENPKLLNNND